ncbi:winged helix-turn-helix domain-containing protein [Pseudohongiella spirulinae]|uniref:Transcriptional regulator n=1 Tax=Pseudohongiella spirulinae TaxID=1249552 RepID=A0A0S2KBW2_9GAMM|nr:transcriptional regulator [Pseudohongiella spirulinae]ALO45825.1 transcriptional regulator [Pseudohongiella spirulinae]
MAVNKHRRSDEQTPDFEQKTPASGGATAPGKLSPARDLDNLIHERTRLALISALAVHGRMSFSELKTLLNMTDGNLSVQARKLEEAGYLSCDKQFEGRKPKTEFALTNQGRKALQRYVDHMEALIGAMKQESNP